MTIEELIATLQEIARALPGAEVVAVDVSPNGEETGVRPPIIVVNFGRGGDQMKLWAISDWHPDCWPSWHPVPPETFDVLVVAGDVDSDLTRRSGASR